MKILIISAAIIGTLLTSYSIYSLSPAGVGEALKFEIKKGDGFREIAVNLADRGLVRSPASFKIYSVLAGVAAKLKPGFYTLSSASSTPEIIRALVAGPEEDIAIVITEGETVLDINAKLKSAGIISTTNKIPASEEGRLFPDTYRFYPDSPLAQVLEKFHSNFRNKTAVYFDGKSEEFIKRILTMASLIEKEAPDFQDRLLISGVLWKRLNVGMPLQVDAAICYAKLKTTDGCYPLRRSDFSSDSRYNTYKYYDLPPGPIGNPGLSAIEAALEPQDSDYWYYLSDPKTGRTIFAKTLEEHGDNRARYLGY